MHQITEYSVVKTKESYDQAIKLCKGSYQRHLIQGVENLSGSSLAGAAKSYGARYKRSRDNLLERLKDNGLNISEQRGEHNKRILVIE